MTDMVSVLDVLENAPYGAQKAIRDEIAGMDAELRRRMDSGLSPDEMRTAQAARTAVQSAASILEKLFA